jgi:hypothetical protein
MITAERLSLLTTYNAGALHKALGKAAEEYEFTGAKFLGITNGGQFCYSVVFRCPDFRGTDSAKVFLTYNPSEDRVIADIS